MKKNEKSQGQAATVAASSVGSVIGAAAGVVGGTFLNQELHAAEPAPSSQPTTEPEPEPEPISVSNPEPAPQLHPQPAPQSVTEPEPKPDVESDVHVLEYERGEIEGTPVEMAVVEMDEQEVVLVDVTGDRYVDLAGVDVNGDDEITEDELFNVQEEGIPMETFSEAYEAQEVLANNTPDYVNDGDIDDFTLV